MSRPLGHAALVASLALTGWTGAGADEGALARGACPPGAALTLLGVDTAARQALFAARDGGWIALALGDAPHAAGMAAPAGALGASFGRGAIVVVTRCGDACLRAAALRDGGLAPLGEDFVASPTANVAATYDAAGTPWIVLLEPGGAPGVELARAFRLQGSEWRAAGALRVTHVGAHAAHAVPGAPDAITCGTGMFHGAGEPSYWLDGLPDLPPGRRGEVVPLGDGVAAVIAADGVVYRTRDRGAQWRRALWTPWSSTVVQPWTAGRDYQAELPAGDLALPLPLVWYDRRHPEHGDRIVLATMTADGDWRVAGESPAVLPVPGGEPVESGDVLRFETEWDLVAGCAANGVAVRRLRDGVFAPTAVVPLAR